MAAERQMADLENFIMQSRAFSAVPHVHVGIAFTSSMRPIGVFEVSFGTINVSLVCPRDIFARLLLVNAACFALTHNHPSGDVSPSREDKQITEQIKAASEIMGIPLIDHVIVGEGYYSFRESSGIL